MRNENDFYLRLDRFSILLMESWTRLDSTVWKHPKQQTRISADFYHVCSGMGFSLCSWQFIWRKREKKLRKHVRSWRRLDGLQTGVTKPYYLCLVPGSLSPNENHLRFVTSQRSLALASLWKTKKRSDWGGKYNLVPRSPSAKLLLTKIRLLARGPFC